MGDKIVSAVGTTHQFYWSARQFQDLLRVFESPAMMILAPGRESVALSGYRIF